MANLAQLADAAPLTRTLESLAGSDTLFSRVGGLDADPAALALAALPPLGLGSVSGVSGALDGSALGGLPLAGAALPGVALPTGGDGVDLSSLLGSTSLGGGLPIGPLTGGLPLLGGGDGGSIIDAVTGGLDLGQPTPGASTLGSVADLLTGDDPGVATTDAVETAVATVGHVGSGAVNAIGALGSSPEQSPIDTLNNVIDQLHLGIEAGAHTSGLNYTLHTVTNLGGTVGLGDIGGDNLLTDVVDLPSDLLAGDLTGSLSSITGHLGDVVEAAPLIVEGLLEDIDVAFGGDDANDGTLIDNLAGVLNGGDPIGGVGGVVDSVAQIGGSVAGGLGTALGAIGGGGSPTEVLNAVVGGIHTGIEGAAHESGLDHTLHNVTNLAETVGVGAIGGENLLTDIVGLPGALEAGGLATALSGVVDHVGEIVPAAAGLVHGAVLDVDAALGSLADANPGGTLPGTINGVLSGGDPVAGAATAVAQAGGIAGSLGGGLLDVAGGLANAGGQSPTDTLNQAVEDLHLGIEAGAHTTGLNETLHSVTDLGETVGLGAIGGENLVTDVVGATGVLGGDDPVSGVGDIASHTRDIVPRVETLVSSLKTDLGAATADPTQDHLPLPAAGGGADGLVGALAETAHAATGGGLPEPVGSALGGDLDVGHAGGLDAVTDLVHAAPLGTPEHHGGGLGLL